MPLRLGTRSSRLALWQANWVASELHRCDVAVDIVPIAVAADSDSRPIAQLGTVGVFTKEIQRALLEDRVDLAVHCLKDLPTVALPGLAIAAVLPRESALDCLVADLPLAELPPGARVGTGSVRRRSQLWQHRPDLSIESIRGNVDTRLRQLDEGKFDALVLAEAGLTRLARRERIAEVFSVDTIVPAAGQGALAVEVRSADESTAAALAQLDDQPTRIATEAERAIMRALGGGCDAAIGVHAALLPAGEYCVTAAVLSPDGKTRLHESQDAPAEALPEVAAAIADRLAMAGAQELLR